MKSHPLLDQMYDLALDVESVLRDNDSSTATPHAELMQISNHRRVIGLMRERRFLDLLEAFQMTDAMYGIAAGRMRLISYSRRKMMMRGVEDSYQKVMIQLAELL